MFAARLKSKCPGMRLLACGALAPALFAAVAGEAADLCTEMNGLIAQAGSNFSDGSAGAVAEPAALPGAEACGLSLSPDGQRAFHCAWRFAYRDGGAQAAYGDFNRALEQCFGERARISRDQPVNHPDFYDQRRYRLEAAEVAVSIKDKVARESTYVFLRVQGRQSD